MSGEGIGEGIGGKKRIGEGVGEGLPPSSLLSQATFFFSSDFFPFGQLLALYTLQFNLKLRNGHGDSVFSLFSILFVCSLRQ